MSPYQCPSLGDWKSIPHDDTCPAWDGTSPAPAPAKCTVGDATGDAVRKAGADPKDPAATILPDGRRVKAFGAEWLFDDAGLVAGLPVRALPIAGTTMALVVDAGYGPHAVRLIDTALVGTGDPVLSSVRFDAPETLNQGIVVAAPDLVFVATDDGVVQALTLDQQQKKITRSDARSIALPQSVDDTGSAANYFVSGLAVSPDGTKLVVSSVLDNRVLVYDLKGTYGKLLGSLTLDAPADEYATFDVAFDPADASGHYAYVSRMSKRSVVEVDLSDPTAPKQSRTFTTDKDPMGMAFLDARWMAVGNAFGDTVTLVDRVTGQTTPVAADAQVTLHGQEPTTLAYDAAAKRLYATLAGQNAVAAWDVDLGTTPPTLTPAGRLATSWWPTSVVVLPSGGLLITSGRGHSNGPIDKQFPPAQGNGMNGVRGGVQVTPAPTSQDLTQGDAETRTDDDVGALAGAPVVTCPDGEDDFPLPPTNTQGPSKQIHHVIFVVRENKTFDALLGDLPGLDGDPSLTMKTSPADMDKLWQSLRDLVRTFATSDNYYTDAELSIQGHFWTVYGRSSDFMERTWQETGYSRSAWRSAVQPQGIADVGQPQEGSVFDWMAAHGVSEDVLGEATSLPKQTDYKYPGGFIQSIGYPDNEKACYFAGRLRVLCNLGSLVYMTLPNDHTQGVGSATPSPEAMIAVNDEATGMVVDAISHSPFWSSSLVIVTEDDPSGGGEHVDHHRTPVMFASPWIKRGYVSHTHIDTASIHKMLAHIFGLPYPNAVVAKAGLPLDLFTSVPDVTPYTYKPRVWPLSCGEKATLAEKQLTKSWDFTDVDEQPGLGAQVQRVLRGEELKELTPEMKREIQLRESGVATWRR